MKHLVVVLCTLFGLAATVPVSAATLAERLSGRILLQVESHGEAWYVDPVTKRRLFLGRPADAFAIMRAKGLGIRHAELATYLSGTFPARLSGRILLDVERNGEAYYVIPQTRRGAFLGRPADAFAIMRAQGLGITNRDLALIPAAPGTPSAPSTPPASISAIEREAFDLVNAERSKRNLNALAWSDAVATIAREHSANMASGAANFGHDGFSERVERIGRTIVYRSVGENLALTDRSEPAKASVDGWLNSPGHLENIVKAAFDLSGMGAARSADGTVYLTQLFVETP